MCEHGIVPEEECFYCSDKAFAKQAENLRNTALPDGTTIIDTLISELDHYGDSVFTISASSGELRTKIREWRDRLATLRKET